MGMESLRRSELRDESDDAESLPSRYEIAERVRELPREERAGAIAEYRSLVTRQKEELAFLYDDLTAELHQEPDLPYEQLKERLDKSLDALRVDPEGRSTAHKVLFRFQRRRRAIERAMSDESSAVEQFKKIFNVEPKGKVEMVATPFMLYFRCFMLEDYAAAFHGGNTMLGPEKIQAARATGGMQISNPGHGALAGAIAVENCSDMPDASARAAEIFYRMRRNRKDETVFSSIDDLPPPNRRVAIHEEQHAVHRLFFEEDDSYESEEPETLRQRLVRDTRAWRARIADEQARTEILAYFADGTGREGIESRLLGQTTVYNYLDAEALAGLEGDLLRQIQIEYADWDVGPGEPPRLPRLSSEDIALAKGIVRETVKEYGSDVHRALDALAALAQVRSRNEITALLANEPLVLWPRAVERMLKS